MQWVQQLAQILISGYTAVGITVNTGHGTEIFNSWLGQYLYSDQHVHQTATGIQLFGYDNFVTNTIIFNGKIGVPIGGIEETLIIGDVQIDFILNELN